MTLTRLAPVELRPAWGGPDSATLEQGMIELGLTPSASQLGQLRTHGELLLKWNRTYNLMGATDAATLVREHVLDSLAIVPSIGRRLQPPSAVLLDIGSGAGFPGLVLAVMLAGLPVTLIEPNGKKAAFLRQARVACDLPMLRVLENRIEDLREEGGAGETAGGFGGYFRTPHFICRAFTSLTRFANLCRPFLQDGSLLFAMKAQRVDEELEEVDEWVEVLAVEPVRAAARDVQRNLVVMQSRATHPSSRHNPVDPLDGSAAGGLLGNHSDDS